MIQEIDLVDPEHEESRICVQFGFGLIVVTERGLVVGFNDRKAIGHGGANLTFRFYSTP